ncbi:MAG: hypothetical protein ACRDWD_15280 [Acidimicrobiia bacterium]
MAGLVLRVVLAVGAAVTIYVIGAAILRKFHIEPPPEPDPEALVPVDVHYRCGVCGAEVTMTAAPDEEPAPPRHCREDMDLVSRATP